ncbi:putative cytochrome P450 2U1 [Apostichopus japonicus]|uniref:Putative cytochrome P450 2U1 n=1 Tax=Stichopus japonicus TaxID=307972 RepID=A0A2G8L571_STIJA|nr:putative cytochrome P450 2U1 [Apostichopus japonicus]
MSTTEQGYELARRARAKLPPGLTPWPLLGNLPSLIGTEPHLFITKVGNQFGGISTFFKGTSPVVVFNRLDQAVEAYVKQNIVFSDRSIPPLWERSFTSKGSVLWENGPMWRFHRRNIHSGIRHIESSNENLSSKGSSKTEIEEKDIWNTFFDLLGAGSDTSANTLLWGVMYMCGHPEYQERIVEELANVCPASEIVTADMKARAPLTYAAILEVMRCATIVPLGVPRVTARDTRICGYDLPKGTEVWLNEYAIHNDVNLWEEPNLFRPERFLNASRDSILTEKRNQLVAFGLGRRICVGKKLAEVELFIVFSNLFKRYRVRFAEPNQKIDKVGIFGLTYFPKPFKVILEKRTDSKLLT